MEFFKNNKTVVIAAIVIIILIGFSLRNKNNQPATLGNPQAGQEENTNTEQEITAAQKPLGELPWTGVLKASQEPEKGNLVLISGNHEIYIRTSRDFSGLIDKTVLVSGSGDINSFQLGDITAVGK